jgi:hypothetical protein
MGTSWEKVRILRIAKTVRNAKWPAQNKSGTYWRNGRLVRHSPSRAKSANGRQMIASRRAQA